MSGPIVLSEYQDEVVTIDHVDAAFIATRLGDRIRIRRTLAGDTFVVNPAQHVGLVTLPSGRRLEVRPKVPARNLFYMVSMAYDLPDPFLDAPANVDRFEDVLSAIVARFASMVEEQIDRGLYRSYVETEDNLSTVRGRIMVADDMRRNHVLRHRTYCRYSEYAWDVPENQVLRQVVRLLDGWQLPSRLRRRLRTLDAALEEITPGSFVASDLDRFNYHRMNVDYRPLHMLCKFFLDGTSPSEESGPFGFEAFLLDMNRLFEAFVTRTLQNLVSAPLTVRPQLAGALDTRGSVPIRPDMVIRLGNRNLVVADCKYKRLDAGQHKQQDLYQMLAYCTALGVERGILVYPQHLVPTTERLAILGTRVQIEEHSLALSGSPESLVQEIRRLARTVRATVSI